MAEAEAAQKAEALFDLVTARGKGMERQIHSRALMEIPLGGTNGNVAFPVPIPTAPVAPIFEKLHARKALGLKWEDTQLTEADIDAMVASGKLSGYKAFLESLRPYLSELHKPHVFKFWYDMMPEFFDAINMELKLKAKAIEEWADLATKPLTRESLATNIALMNNPEYVQRMYGEPAIPSQPAPGADAQAYNFMRGSLSLNRFMDLTAGLAAGQAQAATQKNAGLAIMGHRAKPKGVPPLDTPGRHFPMWSMEGLGATVTRGADGKATAWTAPIGSVTAAPTGGTAFPALGGAPGAPTAATYAPVAYVPGGPFHPYQP